MRIITSRPIYNEPKSNCCGMSNADGSYSNCCGMSNADGEGSIKELIKEGREYLSEQKSERQSGRSNAVKNVLNDRTIAKDTRRTNRETKRTDRQVNRSQRKESRFQRRQDRKSKKNSKKLALIKTQGRERYFFPLSRVRLGKKKYKDGTTAEVKTADQVTITTATGEIATFDKNDIAKGLGTTKDQLTQAQIQSLVAPLPKPIVEEQNLNKELAQPLGEPVFSVPVPEQLVETANDGELYLSEDVQNTNETEKDVKDEEKGLSKTQKIVLWTAGAVVLGIVGYIIYKSVSKSKTGI